MLRVSLVNSICLLPDAISAGLAAKIRMLDGMAETGELEFRTFVYAANIQHPSIVILRDQEQLAFDRFFNSSDIVIYEFGAYHDLINSIFLLPKKIRKLVHFHNITPERLVPSEDARGNIRRALRQRANLFRADHILAGSPFNKQDLVDYGIHESRISVHTIPLPAGFSPADCAVRDQVEEVRALYVGRFVPSKGVLDAVKAVHKAIAEGNTWLKLELVGDLTWYDEPYLNKIRAYIATHKLSDSVKLTGSLGQEALVDRYRASDILLLPSHHEGFCMPVIEALSCGCVPVTSNAANLPNIVNGLGAVVPAGDVDAYAKALTRVGSALRSRGGSGPNRVLPLDHGALTVAQFVRAAKDWLASHTADHLRAEFRSIIRHQASYIHHSAAPAVQN